MRWSDGLGNAPVAVAVVVVVWMNSFSFDEVIDDGFAGATDVSRGLDEPGNDNQNT